LTASDGGIVIEVVLSDGAVDLCNLADEKSPFLEEDFFDAERGRVFSVLQKTQHIRIETAHHDR